MSFTFTPTPQTGTATHFEILRIKTYLSRHNKKKKVSMRYCIIFVTCYIGSCLYVASDLQKEIISKGRLYGILSFFRSRGKNVILLILGLLRIKVSSAPSFVRCEPFYPVHLPKWNCRTPAFSQERCPCR